MTSTSTSEAQLRNEIARLTASINLRKTEQASKPSTSVYPSRYNASYNRRGTHQYVNPNYKSANTYVNPNYKPTTPSTSQSSSTSSFQIAAPPPSDSIDSSSEVKSVILGGVEFQSSTRSLVRKDAVKPASTSIRKKIDTRSEGDYTRKSGHLIASNRTYKPKSMRGRGGRRGRAGNRNMTLNNSRPYQSRRNVKRMKYVDKPCPRFTTTGACSRGLTCLYQHDPSKIAICWPFLQGTCSNTAETCNLSHDPTPERTPLCHHFLNKGRCTRQDCPYPHVNVGLRQGVCRDFAVLGYCAKGLDCDKQHVRECPDFAENGTCTTKGCKLPHVIRANRNRKGGAPITEHASSASQDLKTTTTGPSTADKSDPELTLQRSAADAQLGDEFISLTFNESESDEDDSEEEEEIEDESGSDEAYENDDTEEPINKEDQ